MYNAQDIAERIKSTAKQQGVPIKDILSSCGLSKNTISSMLSGGSTPKSENLAKIADYLDVPVDYLLGRTDDPNQKPGESNIKLDEFSYAMYNESKELSDSDKERLLSFARMLRESSEVINDD